MYMPPLLSLYIGAVVSICGLQRGADTTSELQHQFQEFLLEAKG